MVRQRTNGVEDKEKLREARNLPSISWLIVCSVGRNRLTCACRASKASVAELARTSATWRASWWSLAESSRSFFSASTALSFSSFSFSVSDFRSPSMRFSSFTSRDTSAFSCASWSSDVFFAASAALCASWRFFVCEQERVEDVRTDVHSILQGRKI